MAKFALSLRRNGSFKYARYLLAWSYTRNTRIATFRWSGFLFKFDTTFTGLFFYIFSTSLRYFCEWKSDTVIFCGTCVDEFGEDLVESRIMRVHVIWIRLRVLRYRITSNVIVCIGVRDGVLGIAVRWFDSIFRCTRKSSLNLFDRLKGN